MDPGMYGPGDKLPPGGGLMPSAPPPSEPPSYEEAIAIGGGIRPLEIAAGPPMSTAPYPVMPSMHQMPMPSVESARRPLPTPYPVLPHEMPMPMPDPRPYVPERNHMPGDPVIKQPTAQPHADGDNTRTRTCVIEYVPLSLSANPVKTKCLFCNVDVKTITISDHQPSAHICCIILFCMGCCLCSCLPYFMNTFKRVHHFCPNCKNYMGTWKG